jgi:ABC-type nitrate/sulfonate/bicarbonate transport system substrate-binding protein
VRGLRYVAGAAVVALALAGCSSGGGGAASADGGTTKVTIGGAYKADFGLVWIAKQQGFFRQQGIDVSTFDTSGVDANATMSAFLGGQFPIIDVAAPTEMFAKQSGGHLHAVMAMDTGEQIEVTVNNAAASAAGVSLTGDPTQQLTALKGSHLSIAVTSTSSPAYNNLVAELKTHGLTIGPGADVNLQTVGSISAQVAGLKAGRLAAAASTPPSIPVIPNTTVINLGKITPLSQSVGQYLCVADSFAAAHPKTVQAVVTAITQAWNYARQHPAQAERLISSLDKVNGVTDPAEVHTLFADSSSYWRTPLMERTGFTSAVHTVNLAQQQGLTLSYDDFADPKYVNTAVRQLHLQVPAG